MENEQNSYDFIAVMKLLEESADLRDEQINLTNAAAVLHDIIRMHNQAGFNVPVPYIEAQQIFKARLDYLRHKPQAAPQP